MTGSRRATSLAQWEALGQWRRRVADLPDGWIILSHEPDPQTVVEFTAQEYVAWLRDMTARFRAVREQAP